jgi:hypothetical protein
VEIAIPCGPRSLAPRASAALTVQAKTLCPPTKRATNAVCALDGRHNRGVLDEYKIPMGSRVSPSSVMATPAGWSGRLGADIRTRLLHQISQLNMVAVDVEASASYYLKIPIKNSCRHEPSLCLAKFRTIVAEPGANLWAISDKPIT